MKMGKKLILVLCIVVRAGFLLSFTSAPKPEVAKATSDVYLDESLDQKDWNSCVAKQSSEWSGRCLNYGFSDKKYTVHLQNTCGELVDLMACVQRDNDRWRCFYRLDMDQTDTLHAYACRGNGKYLKWVREAGDITTKFPTLKEVNEQY